MQATIEVHLIAPDGARRTITGRVGQSLMRAAVDAGEEGIAADCGGCLNCATCHVIVDAAWFDRVGAPSDDEGYMLEMTASPQQPTSRLSCQVDLHEGLDGLVIQLPQTQY
ncbi:MAG TPA: 2Fe-2S iron-sulfur cluster-binding protein [Burkholderiaceae bacterium]|nr:2Fe-2S iron-sulfur cluster-binding protein [Burkholderiaceae bacterium]